MEYLDFFGGSLSECLNMQTKDLFKWIKVSRKFKNKERLNRIQDYTAPHYNDKNYKKYIDRIKLESMTDEELQEEIEKSAREMDSFGRI